MDTFPFASLAQVRILLIPIGTLPQAKFESYATEIRSFETIRLGDIPPGAKDEKARFLPNPLSTGHLHLSFPTHARPPSHNPLSILRPSHFTLAIIGVAECSHAGSIQDIATQFGNATNDLFPSRGLFPLARNCFVYESESSSGTLDIGGNFPGLIVIPNMMGNKKLYIGTLLADLCSNILGEFGTVVQTLESPLGNEYLNSSVMPILPPLSDIPSSLHSEYKKDSVHPTLHTNQLDANKIGFGLSGASSLKRNSTTMPGIRQSTLNVQTPKKRVSTIGTASSHARLYKLLGDFFLLAGRLEDASVWYSEASQLFKSFQDPIWYAGTLEGMATISIMEAWSTGQGLHNSTAASKEPWAEVGEKMDQAASLYMKAPITEVEQTNSFLAYLHCCCVLRHTTLLFAIWSAKGWGPLAFTTMLHPGPRPYLPPTLSHDFGDSWLTLERLSSISGVTRSSIAAILSHLHGPWLLHLGSQERLAVLEAAASTYACLGYHRKEAYILREVLGCIMDLVVCGRDQDEEAQWASNPRSSGLGIQSETFSPITTGTVGIRLSESVDGNSAILDLLKYTCRILGINLNAVTLLEADSNRDSQDELPVATRKYENEGYGEYQELQGWPELQVGVVREAVAVAEALPDFPAVSQFALSSLKTLHSFLSSGDQFHLYATASRALMTARRRGDARFVEYWSGRPVVGIDIAPLPLIRLPLEKHISTLHNNSGVVPLLQGVTDPFLYNPRRAAVGKGKSLVVQNELLEFIVVLQNPYVFDLELQSLSLSTVGVPFSSQPIRVIIPSNSIYQVVVAGKPLEPGELTVRGCYVQCLGGNRREFIVPLLTNEEGERIMRKRSAMACEIGRLKYSGLNSFNHVRRVLNRSSEGVELASTSKATLRFLECKVVPEQPLLRIRRSSITHGALMMYEGERSTVRITVENVSSLPVDFLHLAFEDSTMAKSQQALAEGNMSVFETYETEYDLIHKPLFAWEKKQVKNLEPGHSIILSLTCFGKSGCKDGIIHVSYSFLEPSKSTASDVFYTRQLSYPVVVTVYQMLECHGMDILPFPINRSKTDSTRSQEIKTKQKELFLEDEAGWCLFSIDVRNTYGSPFDVTFERVQEGVPSITTSTTIPPGSMSRLVLPIKKIILSDEQLDSPIPTLSDRQFVVTKSKISEEESRAQRELFWYREALFKCVRGRWQETGGTRTGDISLRQQHMTTHMLDTFRLEAARIQMQIRAQKYATPDTFASGRYFLRPNEFVYLRTRVTNLTNSSLVFNLDLNIEPPDCVIHQGVLSNLAIGHLESGESRDTVTAICFIADGRFNVSALVKPFGIHHVESRVARGHIVAVVQPQQS